MFSISSLILFLIGLSGVHSVELCFPNDFLFGTATSASQIEGGWNKDGRSESIWDHVAHNIPGFIEDGSNCDVASDSYHKYKEDVALLKDMGAQFYRLSLSWSRILPSGTVNNVNEAGVEYYIKVLKLLKENRIEPMVTLYHFDLPQTLQEMGGWTNPLLADYFGDYARLCYERFGQYVKWWLTVNEPSTTCLGGYGYGFHAPGMVLRGTGIYLCAYVHAIAHAKAYHIYDDEFRAIQGGKVSAAISSSFLKSQDGEDEELAIIAMDFEMGLWAHPIYRGDWPEHVKNRTAFRDKQAGLLRNRLPLFTQEEVDYINGTYDFFGLNYYMSSLVYKAMNITDDPTNDNYLADRGYGAITKPEWTQSSGSQWLFNVPWGLRDLVNWIHEHYNAPDIFITENGWSDDGSSLNDIGRIDYMKGHLCNLYYAMRYEKLKILGHAVWSLIDNWEWSGGYTAKFGMVSVDFADPDRPRTPKESFYWYKSLLEERCIDNDTVCSTSVLADW